MLKKSAERQRQIEAILAYFLNMPTDGIVDYRKLSSVAGEEIGPSSYPLRRAIANARDQHNCLITNERGIGFRRAGDYEDKAKMLQSRRGRVRRQALTGLKESGAVARGTNLTAAQMMDLTRVQGAFAVAHMQTGGSPATQKKAIGTIFEGRADPTTVPK